MINFHGGGYLLLAASRKEEKHRTETENRLRIDTNRSQSYFSDRERWTDSSLRPSKIDSGERTLAWCRLAASDSSDSVKTMQRSLANMKKVLL